MKEQDELKKVVKKMAEQVKRMKEVTKVKIPANEKEKPTR